MATATLPERRITPDQFAELPNNEAYELVDGELVERGEMGLESQKIGHEIARHIGNYAAEFGGESFGDGSPFRAFGPLGDDILKPDAAYVVPGRMDAIPEGVGELAPDLMVEVISPSDNSYDVEEKAQTYLAAGVRAVWVVHPNVRMLQEIRADGDRRVFRVGDSVVCEDILPDFAMELASVFPTLPST